MANLAVTWNHKQTFRLSVELTRVNNSNLIILREHASNKTHANRRINDLGCIIILSHMKTAVSLQGPQSAGSCNKATETCCVCESEGGGGFIQIWSFELNRFSWSIISSQGERLLQCKASVSLERLVIIHTAVGSPNRISLSRPSCLGGDRWGQASGRFSASPHASIQRRQTPMAPASNHLRSIVRPARCLVSTPRTP